MIGYKYVGYELVQLDTGRAERVDKNIAYDYVSRGLVVNAKVLNRYKKYISFDCDVQIEHQHISDPTYNTYWNNPGVVLYIIDTDDRVIKYLKIQNVVLKSDNGPVEVQRETFVTDLQQATRFQSLNRNSCKSILNRLQHRGIVGGTINAPDHELARRLVIHKDLYNIVKQQTVDYKNIQIIVYYSQEDRIDTNQIRFIIINTISAKQVQFTQHGTGNIVDMSQVACEINPINIRNIVDTVL